MPTEPTLTLTELADLAGVTPRTIRYYISQGLLSVDVTPGPGPKYDDNDVARLRLIKRLQREHLPLAEIRRRLAGVSDAAVDAFFGTEPVPPDSALDYIRRVASAGARAAEAPPPYSQMEASPSAMAPPPLASAEPSATRLERSQWERIELAPDIELHIRRPLARPMARQVDRLITIARDLFQEET